MSRAGGGKGLEAARKLGPAATIEEITASGLRGRGGAGFPTGRKWRTVVGQRAGGRPADRRRQRRRGRAGLVQGPHDPAPQPLPRRSRARSSPPRPSAPSASSSPSKALVPARARAPAAPPSPRSAAAGWTDTSTIVVFEGPTEYLFGEETALLEVDRRAGAVPAHRPALPPGRRRGRRAADATSLGRRPTSRWPPPGGETRPPPTLVDNAETMANVARHPGPGRRLVPPGRHRAVAGHDRLHRHRRHAPRPGWPSSRWAPRCARSSRRSGRPGPSPIKAVLSGVANPFLPGDRLDTPVTYEAMEAAGTGLGAAGFLRVRRRRRPRRRRRRRGPLPGRRVVRPVHALQAGRPRHRRHPHPDRRAGRPSPTTPSSSAPGSPPSATRPAAPSPASSSG